MARDMGPGLKKCRSLGIEPTVIGIDKKSNRKFARAGKKVSEYGLQLREKQKAKFIYGVLEKPFRNNFNKAKKLHYGTTGENMLILLELRLDNVMFRLGYGRTRTEARQIVDHKHVLVNGKCVNIPSYKVKVGDVLIGIASSGVPPGRYLGFQVGRHTRNQHRRGNTGAPHRRSVRHAAA